MTKRTLGAFEKSMVPDFVHSGLPLPLFFRSANKLMLFDRPLFCERLLVIVIQIIAHLHPLLLAFHRIYIIFTECLPKGINPRIMKHNGPLKFAVKRTVEVTLNCNADHVDGPRDQIEQKGITNNKKNKYYFGDFVFNRNVKSFCFFASSDVDTTTEAIIIKDGWNLNQYKGSIQSHNLYASPTFSTQYSDKEVSYTISGNLKNRFPFIIGTLECVRRKRTRGNMGLGPFPAIFWAMHAASTKRP
ncbi:Uncharacterized protein TCM_033781 [Theobroma cacao]|uniref:Uncharacterized protein n=1 Tax=Theobroma cacao TaxID=3641 RepID=A0A061FBU5_THECC|nr:Uncharacterized protein TCM_033781 [Theobroma cacao]